MWPTHLHLGCWNTPLAFGQIKLSPFGLAKFAGADKDQRSQFEGLSSDGMPLKTIDGSEQGTHCVWLDNRGPVRHGGGDEGAAEIAGWRTRADARMVPLADNRLIP
jgi:hypothetical protein